MKRLNLLMYKSYIGPLVLTFFISMFILLMQFLWKYIDDLVGKGLEWRVIVELLIYASPGLVVYSLPLSVLMASIMTFGNLGEHNELVALKSSGISLFRIMMPLIVFSAGLGIFAFFFFNNVMPYTNLKTGSLLFDIKHQRPVLDIKEGIFNNDLEGYTIKISPCYILSDQSVARLKEKGLDEATITKLSKIKTKLYSSEDAFTTDLKTVLGDEMYGKHGKTIFNALEKKKKTKHIMYNFILYDHTDYRGNTNVTIADSASMYMTKDTSNMILTMYSGRGYEEVTNETNRGQGFPHRRYIFDEQRVVLELRGFKFTRTNDELFRHNYQMQNLSELQTSIDSLESELDVRKKEFAFNLININYLKTIDRTLMEDKRDSLLPANYLALDPKNHKVVKDLDTMYSKLSEAQKAAVLDNAETYARSAESYISTMKSDIVERSKWLRRFEAEWHRKFTLSIACLLLFFIGAPLGAIIRKGGLGVPILLSAFFFVAYYVISISGEKFVKEDVIAAHVGMWISTVVLLPLSVFLTYKAANDSVLLNIDTYSNFFRKIFANNKKESQSSTNTQG